MQVSLPSSAEHFRAAGAELESKLLDANKALSETLRALLHAIEEVEARVFDDNDIDN